MPTSRFFLFGTARLLSWTALASLAAGLSASTTAAQGPSGEQIYRKQCASCHGALGEGGEGYPQALEGDRSMADLSRFIAKTMPREAPRKCTPEEAEKVAGYIYQAFYSRAAQERNKPARIELS